MQQANSLTQQLIYRTSYRKHRDRLINISQNAISHDFTISSKHPDNKRFQMNSAINDLQRLADNKVIQAKFSLVNKRSFNQNQHPFSINGIKTAYRQRYERGNQKSDDSCKLQMKSDEDQSQSAKINLPGAKARAFSFAFNQKKVDSRAYNRDYSKNSCSFQRSDKKFQSINVPRESGHQILMLLKKERDSQIEFNLPQRNQNRKVIHKKTIILSPMQSALLQLSLIGQKLLIAAYLMGIQNYKITQLFSVKQTKKIMKDYKENYEELCSKIVLQKIDNKYRSIRIMVKENTLQESKKIKIEQNISKNKLIIQNSFIKRNYHDLIKKEKEQQLRQHPLKQDKNVSIQKVQALVQRLAVPKKYSKDENNILTSMSKKIDPTKSRVASKAAIIASSLYNQPMQEIEKRRNQMEQIKKVSSISIKYKQNPKQEQQKNKNDFLEAYQSQIKQNKIQLNSMQKNEQEYYNDQYKQPSIQDDQEVQYLVKGVDDQYNQQFQNPSDFKNPSETKQILQEKYIKHDSNVSKQIQCSKPVQSNKNNSELYQNIYEEEQNNNIRQQKQKDDNIGQDEQSYKEQFQLSKDQGNTILKNQEQRIKQEQVIEESYHQQFDN